MATARARGAALSTMPTSPAHTRRSSCAAATLALFLFGACQGAPESASTKPRNVILMMADDLASNDLSCYGGRNIQTPHLDALAADSLRLTDYYAGSAVCTPSRMALLSGAYPARLGWRWGVLGYGFPSKTGMSGAIYGVIALVLGIEFWRRCWRVWKSEEEQEKTAKPLFLFSIFYLFMIFVAMLVDRLLVIPVM